MRPIDANKLIARLKELYAWAGWDPHAIHFSLSDMISNIEGEPTIDITAVDVMLSNAIEKEKRHYERITNAGLQYLLKTEPEHGHWIINDEWCTCSECKQSLHYERSKGKSNLINAMSMAVHYCPNCGAKMDEKITEVKEK